MEPRRGEWLLLGQEEKFPARPGGDEKRGQGECGEQGETTADDELVGAGPELSVQ
ncbi:hypothetical protein ACFYWU_16270 [Streptomyces chrestomyceticus]|uniref:hypothetical protein n=1 Tax=Streptomyces chrestomyceticus TaxID=68185 RepID=UPI00368E0B74